MKHDRPLSDWLPLTKKEAEYRGWDELDVIIVSGDAYVDHPSFGGAVIARIIESEGFKVGIIAQPDWRGDLRDFKKFGKPRLFFGVTSGCMDSMVNHYTAGKRRRSDDAYTPDGQAGARPDYATTVYTQCLKQLYPDVPVVIGGVEASLRRVTHYDYWSDQLKPSVLVSSQADLLVYGMGEQPLRDMMRLLDKGVPFHQLTSIPQTSFLIDRDQEPPKNKNWDTIELNHHEKCLRDKKAYAANFKHVEQESNKVNAKRIVQAAEDWKVVINPPFLTMTEQEIDQSFDLPYTRLPHPKYAKRGPIPAYEMIKFSINMHRGCFGGCSFCTISAHQGKFIASRSQESVLKEVKVVTEMPDFKGYISDLGGPSANMYGLKGIEQAICDVCARPSCIHPTVCKNLDTDHSAMTELYQKVDANPKVKKAFIGSGIRYDLLVEGYNKQANQSINDYLEQVISRHTSGRLKVAPEHTSEDTLQIMRKPAFKHFHSFKRKFDKINDKLGMNQQLIPYFISSHPGCKEEDSANLAAETKDMGFQLEQVQDFTPTPMTVATVIYYSGYHPYTMEPIFTAKSPKEKKAQNMFFFWHKPEYKQRIRQRLNERGHKKLARRLLDEDTPQRDTRSSKRANPNKRSKVARKKAPNRQRAQRSQR